MYDLTLNQVSTNPLELLPEGGESGELWNQNPQGRVGETSDAIASLLSSYSGHGLSDLSKASLMNRVDTKFVLPLSFLPQLLASLQDYYTVLDIGGDRIFHYENTYYDTPDFQFYQMHHNGKLNRYKVRHRKYLETETEFLEVKFKNNKKRTIKTRIEVNSTDITLPHPHQFLEGELHGSPFLLEAKQLGRYQRISLANEALGERVTLDFNLEFQRPDGTESHFLDQVLIVELKQGRINKNSPCFELMTHYNRKPESFSKYCIGCGLLYPEQLKINQFKPNFLKIATIQQSREMYDIRNHIGPILFDKVLHHPGLLNDPDRIRILPANPQS